MVFFILKFKVGLKYGSCRPIQESMVSDLLKLVNWCFFFSLIFTERMNYGGFKYIYVFIHNGFFEPVVDQTTDLKNVAGLSGV